MKWYWCIPITFAIIGFFGMFWTLNLSDITVDFTMDNNSRYVFMEALRNQSQCECESNHAEVEPNEVKISGPEKICMAGSCFTQEEWNLLDRLRRNQMKVIT